MDFLRSIRGFSTLDFITLVTSVTAVAAISGPIVQRSFQAERLAAAERELKKMAFEMAQNNTNTNSTTDQGPGASGSDGRNPASEEQSLTALDPWGSPYKAKFLRNSYGIPTHLVVWSPGPNGQHDTARVESSSKTGATAVVFDGDDIGYITSVR